VHEAVKWLQKAADAGIPMGREELANLYGSKGIENHEKSFEGYSKSAQEGSPTAQFDLALMYDLGKGVPRNYEEAMKWYRKAADQGYAPAMTNIGILYYNQEGVARDLVQAYAWFVRAKLAQDPRATDLLQMTMDKLKAIRSGRAKRCANWHPQKPSARRGGHGGAGCEVVQATGASVDQPDHGPNAESNRGRWPAVQPMDGDRRDG
jgi:hypothetical protein